MRILSPTAYSQVLCMTVLLFSAAHAQQLLNPITEGSDWERWVDPPPVSGGLRVGLMTNTSVDVADPEHVYVSLPESESFSLCIEISSRDARYSARLEYDIQDVEAGEVKLHIPTEKKSELAEFDGESLVVLASLPVDECNGSVDRYLVSSWQQSADGESDVIIAFLNSGNPAFIAVGPDGDIEHEPSCERISGERTAFNQRCEIRRSWIEPDTVVSIRIREAGTRIPFDFPLSVP